MVVLCFKKGKKLLLVVLKPEKTVFIYKNKKTKAIAKIIEASLLKLIIMIMIMIMIIIIIIRHF